MAAVLGDQSIFGGKKPSLGEQRLFLWPRAGPELRMGSDNPVDKLDTELGTGSQGTQGQSLLGAETQGTSVRNSDASKAFPLGEDRGPAICPVEPSDWHSAALLVQVEAGLVGAQVPGDEASLCTEREKPGLGRQDTESGRQSTANSRHLHRQ